jgi:CRISPR/Cas system-associated protein endoribonuclease Cas2
MAKSCLFNRWRSKKGFCNGKESFEAHLKRIEPNLPEKGDVHVLTFTDRQYETNVRFPSQGSLHESEFYVR